MTLLTLLAPVPEQQQIPTIWQSNDSGIRIAVEVAFRSNPLDATLLWEDISDHVNSVAITRGRSGELDRFQPSTAAITVTSTGRDFDPEYTSGPWYGYIKPNRPVRVRVQYAGVEYFVWQGFVDEWPQDYTGMSAAQVTIPCSDAFAWLSRISFDSPFVNEIALDRSGASPPRAWYRLGEATTATTMVDSLGYASGTYEGAPTLGATSLVAASSDTAVTFTAGGATRGDVSSAALITSTTTFAVEFMHKGASPGDTNMWFSAARSTLGTPDMKVACDTAALGSTAIFLSVNGNGPDIDAYWLAAPILDGNEHHVVIGLDGGVPKCYFDGALVTVARQGGSSPDSFAGSLIYSTIGNTSVGARAYGIGGTMDEVVVWDGVFPSATRIAAHATAALTGWTGDTTAEAAGKVLDAVGWPDAYQSIGTGATIIAGVGLTGNAYDVLMTLADTEGGQCYVDGQGRIVFRGRTEMGSDTRSAVSQAVFGDA